LLSRNSDKIIFFIRKIRIIFFLEKRIFSPKTVENLRKLLP
jgi:hypothetical protein